MEKRLISFFSSVFFFLVSFQRVKSLCLVEEKLSEEIKACVFPFAFNNQVFTACTNVTLLNGLLWCSTKVTDDGIHVGKIGYWGYCDMTNPSCRGEPDVEDVRAESFLVVTESTTTEATTTKVTTEATTTEATTKVTTEAKRSDDENLGTWKPSAEKGECGTNVGGAQFILGGTDASPGEFPFMALLGYESKDGRIEYGCGGTLLNKFYVLTAAHCHTSADPIRTVRLGERIVGEDPDCTSRISCSPPVQDIGVAYVIQHDNWISAKQISRGFDIALIRLAKPANLNGETVYPICLPWSSVNPRNDLNSVENGTIVGWGRITNDDTINQRNLNTIKVSQKSLQRADVPILEESVCVDKLGAKGKIIDPEKFICAGGVKDIDTCQGDSGGPLIYRQKKKFGHPDDEPWFQIGVVSFGSRKCGMEIPGYFTKVVNYMDWIEKSLLP